MPKILMKESTPGSLDGIVTKLFEEGQEYDVNEVLAEAFVTHLRVAEYVGMQRKSEPSAPENASMDITTDAENADASSDVETVAKTDAELTDMANVTDDEKPKEVTVSDLAKEYKKSIKSVLKVAKKLKIDAKDKDAVLSEEEQKKIIEAL